MAESFSLGALLGSLGLAAPMADTSAPAPEAATAGPLRNLFGNLLAEGAAPAEVANTINPVTMNANLEAFLANPLASFGVQVQPELAGLPLQVTGEASAVQILAQQVTILYQQITVQGGFTFGEEGPAGDLAEALIKLGLPADEAQALAAKVETMLELVRQQAMLEKEKLAAEAGGSLVAVLLASLLNPAQAQALQLPANQTTTITSVQLQVVQTQVTISAGSWQAVQARAQNLPAAASLLQAEAPIQAPFTPAPQAAPVTPQVVAQIVPVALPTAGTAEQAAIAAPAPVNVLAIPLPTEALDKATPQPQTPLPTVQAVAAPKPLQGTVMYKLTEAQAGAPVLQALAVMPTAPSTEAMLTSSTDALPEPTAEVTSAPQIAPSLIATAMAPNAPQPTPTSTPTPHQAAATLERLHLAQAAQAGQQLQLAIQPLVQGGKGGAVQLILNPPELGRIEVHLKVENGQISGVIAAQEPALVEHLVRELPSLRQSFLDAGLKIADQGLSLMLSNQQQNPDQQAQNPFAAMNDERQGRTGPQSAASGTVGADDLTQANATTTSRWVSPTQLVDVAA